MDWLQFISSITGSLAWPSAFVFFVFLMRSHLGPLLARLIELHLPGGAKAIFQNALDKAGKEAEAVKAPEPKVRAIRTRDSARGPAMSASSEAFLNASPQYYILDSYMALEAALYSVRKKLDLPENLSGSSTLQILIERELLDSSVLSLFQKLRNARNAAIHVPDKEVTKMEAVQFSTHVNLLRDLIMEASNKLPLLEGQ